MSFDDQCQRSAHQIQPHRKNLFRTPKRPERLHLRPWFYKYFCGEVFVDQIGALSITTLLTYLLSSKPLPATPLRRNILDCFIKINEAWDWLLSHI